MGKRKPQLTDRELLVAVEERKHFGLPWTDQVIRAAHQHPAAVTTRLVATCWWTPDERALIDAKVAATLGAEPDLDRLSGEAKACFAGAVRDLTLPLGGWRVGFTEAPETHLEQLKDGFPYPDRLVAMLAEHTLAELEAVQDEVERSHQEFHDRGLEPTGNEIDIGRNLVVVGAEGVADDDTETEPWLQARFGPVELLANVFPGEAV